MTFEDRIRTALPFLRDIVVGLSRLHRVSYQHGGPLFHLDIKPANVYVRRDDAKGIVCALGDLGFLPPELAFDRTMDTSVDDLPLGTLHFRSPEQKEHFDVANVEAHVEGDAVFLDVRDPKFAGSFIEKGDSVLFSRDKSRTRHIILGHHSRQRRHAYARAHCGRFRRGQRRRTDTGALPEAAGVPDGSLRRRSHRVRPDLVRQVLGAVLREHPTLRVRR